MKTFRFHICHPGESAAGIRPYTDTVTVSVESGEVPDHEEFTDLIADALRQWFDGAGISRPEIVRIESEEIDDR